VSELAGCDEVLRIAAALLPPRQRFLDVPTGAHRRCLVPDVGVRGRLSGSGLCPGPDWGPVGRAVHRAWVALGAACLTARQVCPNRGADWPLGELLEAALPRLATAAVFFDRGRHRKVTLKLLDAAGRPLGYAKYSDTPVRRAGLAQEAHMLQVIPDGIGPRLIRFAPLLEGDLLAMYPLPGRACPRRPFLDASQVGLLERLIRPGPAYPARTHPFVRSLYAWPAARRPGLEAIVAQLDHADWPVAWTHGDFVFCNLRHWRGACLALDWEHGVEDGFPYLDAAFWALGFAKIVRRQGPRQAQSYATGVVQAALPGARKRFAPAITALAVLYKLAGAEA
jgi:hypothetical protein